MDKQIVWELDSSTNVVEGAEGKVASDPGGVERWRSKPDLEYSKGKPAYPPAHTYTAG